MDGKFKISLTTFKAIHGIAPDNICKLVSRKTVSTKAKI